MIQKDGRDLAFITVRVTDANGRTAPRANPLLRFTVEGAGEFVAADNGDPTSFEPFPAPQRHAFNGLCLAIVRAKPGQAGTIKVTVQGEGLKPATVEVRAE